MGILSDGISTALMTSMAFERAAAHPSRSPGRRAAAAACEALTRSTTPARARRWIEALRDPDLRADALAVLDELERLVAEDAPATPTEGTTA
jgi:hypothetical protein